MVCFFLVVGLCYNVYKYIFFLSEKNLTEMFYIDVSYYWCFFIYAFNSLIDKNETLVVSELFAFSKIDFPYMKGMEEATSFFSGMEAHRSA